MQWIWIWPLVAATACALAVLWVQMQPVYEPGMPPPRPSLVGWLAGIVLRPGFHFSRGARWPMVWQSWLSWTLVGWFGLCIDFIARSDMFGRSLILGLLSGIAIAIAAGGIGTFAGVLIARITNMSSFEGKSGFFALSIGVLFGLIGLLAGTIAMTLYFSRA